MRLAQHMRNTHGRSWDRKNLKRGQALLPRASDPQDRQLIAATVRSWIEFNQFPQGLKGRHDYAALRTSRYRTATGRERDKDSSISVAQLQNLDRVRDS